MKTRKELLNEMLQEQPKDAFLNYAFALELAKEGNMKEAIDKTLALLKEQPDYLGAYHQLGMWLFEEGRFSEAKDVFDSGIALAKSEKNNKAAGEMQESLWMLEDELED